MTFSGVDARNPQLSAGIDGTTDPEKSPRYCKDTGHKLKNCLRLQAKEAFQAHHAVTEQCVKLRTPASQGHGCSEGVKVDPLSSSIPAAKFEEIFQTLTNHAVSFETKQ